MGQVQAANGVAAKNGHARIRAVELDDDKPEIQIEAGELPRLLEEALDAAKRDPNLYQRGDELVTVTRQPEGPYNGDERRGTDITLRPGTPRLRPLTTASLTVRLAGCANWQKWRAAPKADAGAGGWVACNPDRTVVAALLDPSTCGGWPGIRPLRAVIESPAMRPDGTIIDHAGYDPSTGYVFLPSATFPKVKDRPTQADAAAALRRLWITMFADFPFRGLGEFDPNDKDRTKRFAASQSCPAAYVGLAALLTQLSRNMIRGAVPGFIFEAASQGSGKTLQMNVVATVATGRAASVMTFPSSHGEPDEAELEKVIASYALAAIPFVAFDNVRGQLGGGALEKVLTAEANVSLRVLGANDLRDLPWSAIVMFSGNNMTMSDDVAQRCLVSRLESSLEDPRKRPVTEFLHADLLGTLREKRPELIRDVLTIIRAFVCADEREKEATRRKAGSVGSYYAWSELIPAAIMYAGGPRIIDSRPDVGDMGQDSESEAHATLLNGWLWGDIPVKAGDIVRALFQEEDAMRRGDVQPDGRDDLRGAVRLLSRAVEGRPPNATSLGMKLRSLRGKWRGGYKIEGHLDTDSKVMKWRRVGKGDGSAPRVVPVPIVPPSMPSPVTIAAAPSTPPTTPIAPHPPPQWGGRAARTVTATEFMAARRAQGINPPPREPEPEPDDDIERDAIREGGV